MIYEKFEPKNYAKARMKIARLGATLVREAPKPQRLSLALGALRAAGPLTSGEKAAVANALSGALGPPGLWVSRSEQCVCSKQETGVTMHTQC